MVTESETNNGATFFCKFCGGGDAWFCEYECVECLELIRINSYDITK